MSAATYIAEVPAIEMKHGKIFEVSTLRALVSRVTAFCLKPSQSVSAAQNARSNELRRERHVCTALMHQ